MGVRDTGVCLGVRDVRGQGMKTEKTWKELYVAFWKGLIIIFSSPFHISKWGEDDKAIVAILLTALSIIFVIGFLFEVLM
jgi:hypothetical protein